MSHQQDLFSKFCPPGTDPIEAWALRLSKMPVSVSVKALGTLIAWHAHMHGTRLRWNVDFWAVANLKPDRHADHLRMVGHIEKLEALGMLRPIRNRDLPDDQRSSNDLGAISWLEVIVTGGLS